jgi:2-methylaconitate cis-trans-isomerase PrpF
MDTTLQSAVEGLLLRGGTSRGLFVRRADLPDRPLDDLALSLFGSPDPIQVDGVGGSHSHTSKLMIVARSARSGVDLDYTFGQVGVTEPTVDWSGNCGNLTSAVGAFGLLSGLLDPPAADGDWSVTLYNTNTDTRVDQQLRVEDGDPALRGDYTIDGIAGTGARVDSTFVDPAGGVTGALFPTDEAHDTLAVDGDEYDVSLVDVATPNVFVRASDLGLSGTELPATLRADEELLSLVERIRGAGAVRMGLAETPDEARTERPGVPQIALVSAPQSYEETTGGTVDAAATTLTSRVFTTGTPHHAYAMTGAMCLAAAARLPGTVPHAVARAGNRSVTVGHPKGRITVDVTVGPDEASVQRVAVGRTTRPIMAGRVFYRDETVRGD